MNTILYATDFSKNSYSALRYGWELCKKTQADLISFHSFDIPTILNSHKFRPTFEEIEVDFVHVNKKKLQKLSIMQLGDAAFGDNITHEVREHKSPVKGIIKKIRERRVDMVIMGSRGESNLRELIMGSTSKAVIERADCPVMVVPYETEFTGIKRIAYASYLEKREIPAIKHLAELAKKFDAEIKVVHVSMRMKSSERKKTKFNDLLRKNISYPKMEIEIFPGTDVYYGLNRFIELNDIDMIAMLEHRPYNFFSRIFHRDVVQEVNMNINIPLLTYNNNFLHNQNKIKEQRKLQLN